MVVWNLSALPASARGQVGGKAAALAQMRQAGYPVPRGFVIPPAAFVDGTLAPHVWEQVTKNLDELRHGHAQPAFAVRSSAIDEDSLSASFAGEFESVIDVRTNDEVRQAIFVVYQSQFSDRVAAYRQIVKNEERGEPNGSLEAGEAGLAVIIQELVPAKYAGVLFTADPLSGSHERMTGNFVPGLGEGLVSGEVDARPFAFIRPSGAYEGPDELHPWARRLYKTAESLIPDLGGPLDIEWAVDDAGLHILQARPVTTMQAYDPIRGDWNDSRRGEYLWSNSNFGEAFPDVMTPLTWSQVQIYAQETFGNPLPEDHPLFGNIGGRLYFNLAIFSAIFKAFGMSRERMNVESEEFFGTLPPDIDIPVVPFKRLAVIRRWVPYSIRAILRRWRNLRALDQFTADLFVVDDQYFLFRLHGHFNRCAH